MVLEALLEALGRCLLHKAQTERTMREVLRELTCHLPEGAAEGCSDVPKVTQESEAADARISRAALDDTQIHSHWLQQACPMNVAGFAKSELMN